jgi:hypothetical protein
MMGRHNRDQGQLFYSFDLDAAVPGDHLMREIAMVCDRWRAVAVCRAGDPQATLKPGPNRRRQPSEMPTWLGDRVPFLWGAQHKM